MPTKIKLTLPLERDQLADKFVFSVVSEEGAGKAMQIAAVQLHSYVLAQLNELSYHKKRVDTDGVGDAEAAASLILLLENAEAAKVAADYILHFAENLTKFGPIAGIGEPK